MDFCEFAAALHDLTFRLHPQKGQQLQAGKQRQCIQLLVLSILTTFFPLSSLRKGENARRFHAANLQEVDGLFLLQSE
jgi:hypothetical protein